MITLGITGRNVLVTGGTSGIGLAVAEGAAGEGAGVGIIGRSPERLRTALAYLRAAHPEANVVGATADVSDDESINAAIDQITAELGGLDHVVSSAGIAGSLGQEVDEVAADEFLDVQRINVLGPFLTAKAALPHLKKGTAPTFTLIGSDSELRGRSRHARLQRIQGRDRAVHPGTVGGTA